MFIKQAALLILVSWLSLGFFGGRVAAAQEVNLLRVGANQDYETINAALEAAQTGDRIEVHNGTYNAPLIIDKTVSIIGLEHPIIDAEGAGSLVIITAPDVHFEGFTLRNSGNSLTREDTGIVIQAPRVVVADNILENVLYGIYFAAADDGLAQNNRVRCMDLPLSRRGDGLRVWYSNRVHLDSNQVFNCRDTLIWHTQNILIENNTFQDGLYGLHFMYSDEAIIRGNTFSNNSVGAYLMYSRHLSLSNNSMLWNRGSSGYGLAFKDADYVTVQDNVLLGNRAGLYIDNSPTLPDINNIFEGNFIAYNDMGMSALPAVARNRFQHNSFLENNQQINLLGRGDLLKNTWAVAGVGNYWSDYVGYDGDGDGVGDMPYRAEKLFENLTDEHPNLRLFTYSPASQAINLAAAAFPSLRPDPKVIDDAPLMQYSVPPQLAQSNQQISAPFLAASLLLIGLGLGLCLAAFRPRFSWGAGRETLPQADLSRKKGIIS